MLTLPNELLALFVSTARSVERHYFTGQTVVHRVQLDAAAADGRRTGKPSVVHDHPYDVDVCTSSCTLVVAPAPMPFDPHRG